MRSWLQRMLKVPQAQLEARAEHLRVMKKAEKALPYDAAIRAAVRAAERAMREAANGR